MLKSFWTSRSKSRIWKMPVQIIIYAVIFWILCQSEWNYASQNRLTCYFQHHCSRYFFIYFKRDYIPNILAVLTSQFLGSEAHPPLPPPPNLGRRSISCLDVYRRRISANWLGFAWNLHHTIYWCQQMCGPKTMKFDGRLSEKTSRGDNWSAMINGHLPVQCPHMGYILRKETQNTLKNTAKTNNRKVSPAVLFTYDTLYA